MKVRGLTKRFGQVTAVDQLSFIVESGEIFGLLGTNGAGKTTAMHLLLGLLEPTGGDVEVLGGCPYRDAGRVRSQINFAANEVRLPFNLTVEQNLETYARLYGVDDPCDRSAELLERFGLSAFGGRSTGSLSTGEQTRLNLCKSMINEPKVLFLDEATSSLDPAASEAVLGMLEKLRADSGTTIIYTSHRLEDVERLCDRMILLHQGRVAAQGTSREIRERFGEASLGGVFRLLAEGRLEGAP